MAFLTIFLADEVPRRDQKALERASADVRTSSKLCASWRVNQRWRALALWCVCARSNGAPPYVPGIDKVETRGTEHAQAVETPLEGLHPGWNFSTFVSHWAPVDV